MAEFQRAKAEQIAKALRDGRAGGAIQQLALEMDAALASKDQAQFVAKAVELKGHIGGEALHIYLKGTG